MRIAALVIVAVPAAAASAAILPENVAVLYNPASADGMHLAQQYAQLRPGVALLPITGLGPTAETISPATYAQTYLPQVESYLADGDNLARTQVLLTTRGLPYRIAGADTFDFKKSTNAAVGSELALAGIDLARKARGDAPLAGAPSAVANPYAKTQTFDAVPDDGDDNFTRASRYEPFESFGDFRAHAAVGDDPDAANFLLTARLDGFNLKDTADALRRAQRTERGKIVLDRDPRDYILDNILESRDAAGDLLIRGAAVEVEARGGEVALDATAASLETLDDPVLAYVGTGTNGNQDKATYVTDDLDFRLAFGALFNTYESFNAETFVEGGNRGQSLIGEWLAAGGTAAAGHAFEPFDLGVSNEEVYLPALLEGYTLAEAIWMSNELAGWQNVLVGDPLMTWPTFGGASAAPVPEPAIGLLAATALLLPRRR